jgi:hypothetical protein
MKDEYAATLKNAQMQLDATDYHLTNGPDIMPDIINRRIDQIQEAMRQMTAAAVAIKAMEEHVIPEHELDKAEVDIGCKQDNERDLAAQVERLAYIIAGLYGCPDRSYAEWCPGHGCAFTDDLEGDSMDAAVVHCWKQVAAS